MRRIRLSHVTALTWALLLVLVVVYRSELGWAWQALPAGYLGGAHPAPPQWLMYNDAERLWSAGGEDAEAIELLERSLEIEPNADPMILLGDILAEQGDEAGALERYREALALDPSMLTTYLRIAEIHRGRGDAEGRLAILESGLAWFSEQEPRFRPQLDPAVRGRFNEKAVSVHAEMTEAIQLLEAQLSLLRRGEDPYAD